MMDGAQYHTEIQKIKNDTSKRKSNTFKTEDVLQALDIFFDSLMSNSDIPDSANSVINRLQLPIVKVATANPDFLTDANHPARRLIKLIITICKQLDQQSIQYSSIYQNILRVTSDVVRKFDGDERIFLRAYFDIKHIGILATGRILS